MSKRAFKMRVWLCAPPNPFLFVPVEIFEASIIGAILGRFLLGFGRKWNFVIGKKTFDEIKSE